jgi:hypothetical protein
MGESYEGNIKCPYCDKETAFYYAPSSGFDTDRCEKCGKEFRLTLSILAFKLDKKKKK